MRVRDGPAAVRGDAPPPRSHWREPGRRRGREPRVRRPVALLITQNPSRKGGFQVLRSLVTLAGAVLAALAVVVAGASGGASGPSSFPVTRRRLERQGHGDEAAGAHRLALADRHRDAVRDRRRPAGRRRRRPVRLPEGRAANVALGLHAERGGDRRLPAGPRRHRLRPEGPLGRARRASASPCSTRTARSPSRARISRSASSARSRDTSPRRIALVSRMKTKIGAIIAGARRNGAGLTVYHELTPDLYSATSKTFVGQVYTALGLRNIADPADADGFGYPQLSAEYVVSSSPDVIVLADTVCCGQKASTVAARPGLGSDQRRPNGLDRAHRRLDRIALGTAARELLPRDVVGARAASPVGPWRRPRSTSRRSELAG